MKARRRADAQARRVLLLLAVRLCVCASARLVAQETSVSIYSDGRVLVRRVLPIAIPRGSSVQLLDLGSDDADPSSLVALDDGVEIKAARVAAGGIEGALRRSIGTVMFFRTGTDSIPKYVRATLLSASPPIVRIDGNVMYGLPGVPVFTDSVAQVHPRFETTIESGRAVPNLRLMYITQGSSWSAWYNVLLPRGGSGQAGVTGEAVIQTGSLALAGAQVQLVAGDIRRAAPQLRMQAGLVVSAISVRAAPTYQEPSAEGLTGTRIYTLPGTVDFEAGETRTLALIPRATASVESEYTLRSGYSIVNQMPEPQRDQHPEIGYRIRRPATTAFGSVALPGGVVRVFEPDSAGRAQLVGEASFAHTPAGRDLRITTGTAFDVTAERSQTSFDRNGDRDITAGIKVELQNARTQAVTVRVIEQCPTRCTVVSSTVPAETGTAVGTLSFAVEVPAGGSASLEYRVRARW